jgi:hypothetical protein
MNIWERVRYTLNLFDRVSWMSERGTWSEHVETSSSPLGTVHIFLVPALQVTRRQVFTFQYDPETKHQSMEWRTETSETPKDFQKLRIRMMLNLF